jgi:hypothetical protein
MPRERSSRGAPGFRAVSLLALALVAMNCCGSPALASCPAGDKACAAKAIRNHPVTLMPYWRQAFAMPVEQRIAPAPAELVDFVALDNIKNDIPNKPRSASVSPEFLRDVRDAISEMPAPVKRHLSRKLAGIYFVGDLGGTGFTDRILDAASKPAAGYVLLDPEVLERKANAWATWKEGTPFKAAPEFRLEAVIEEAGDDNRKNAIQYILLHEFGHVLSIGGNFHPPWTLEPKDVRSVAGYPYFRLSWSVSKKDNKYATIFDKAFPQRKSVVYYFGAKLDAGAMRATYENLERTNMATLYSTNHPADDFAEAFANYVHAVMMGKPFRITIYEGGKAAKEYGQCWEQPRCAEKRKIIERFLEGK